MKQSLEGLRVLDLTHMLAGPFATMMLADMGAETIKVEPHKGEGTRRWCENDPQMSIDGMGVYSLTLNRNKKSVTLDLKSEKGRAIFLDLVRKSDVVVSNFGVGVLQRLKLDYPHLQEVNSRIVCCDISGYGSDGPGNARPSFDLVAQAAGGLMSVTGADADNPTRAGTPIGDIGAGVFAVTGILAALWERERSGAGQQVDISMLDCQVSLLNYMISMVGFSGRDLAPMGNAHPVHVPYNSYRTADGDIVIAVLADETWQRFKLALGQAELEQSVFDTQTGRDAAREQIEAVIRRTLIKHPRSHWLALLNEHRVPAGPVNRISEAMQDAQLLHRQMIVDLQHPNGESRKGPGNPVKMSRSNHQPYAAAPVAGQDNDQVLGALLGYSTTEIDTLRVAGVIT